VHDIGDSMLVKREGSWTILTTLYGNISYMLIDGRWVTCDRHEKIQRIIKNNGV